MTTMPLPNPHDLSAIWDDPCLHESDPKISTSITCTNETITALAKDYDVYQAILATTNPYHG